MNRTRQDAWSSDEDVILADTVLRYIREGKTQLEAFKDVANQLSRTSAACGFRWNATIRKNYQDVVNTAKEERKNRTHNSAVNLKEHRIEGNQETIETAILLLENMKSAYSSENSIQHREQANTVKKLEEENNHLKAVINRYDEAWKEMGNLWSWVKTSVKN
ncbi:RsfA family transcriptional regulator [Virgibacillus phasianinus]|uniref:RsfA family transcriptional regulator n=1 Tax=Virgibacillus phasianinus TaxID=2017483 RepID=A0A220U6C2_9BACI|nr:RsfA family transcriptional regulator [Virgibacillus phasianinus]ASK63595.1 RsfA family transcriptional regulator [Virgibacillus phasianinus]